MTWADVQAFASPPKNAHGPDLVVTEVQNVATAAAGDLRARLLWSNPVDFLLAYLSDPDAPIWGAVATETVLALTAPSKHGSASPMTTGPAWLAATMAGCVDGLLSPGDGGPLVVVPRHGRSGLPLVLVADPSDHLASLGVLAVLDDRASEVGGPEHEERWRDWLRWSNLLQFITLPLVGQEQPLRMAGVWTRRSLDLLAGRHLPLAVGPPHPPAVVEVVVPAWQVVLDYTDHRVHAFVASLGTVSASVLSVLFGRSYNDLDGSLKSRVMDFVVKLQRDPTARGLDLKTPAGVQDRRVRTARVNDSWRAVLLALPDAVGCILVAVKPHDDAYTYANSLVASVNDVTGALEIVNTAGLGAVLERAGKPQSDSPPALLSRVRKRDLLRLGVQSDVADRLVAITDEDELFELADALPRSQSDAVLDLYSGLSPDEVWSSLVADEHVGAVDTEDLTAALARPLSRLSFTDLAGEDGVEELRAVLEGSLAAWRVWLHPTAAAARHPRRVERTVPRHRRCRHRQNSHRPAPRTPPRSAR